MQHNVAFHQGITVHHCTHLEVLRPLSVSSESHLYTVYYCVSLYVVLCRKYTNKICLNQGLKYLSVVRNLYQFIMYLCYFDP